MRACGKKNGAGTRKEYVLKLYVTGATPRSQTAITNLSSICAGYLTGRYALDIVDIYRSPLLAREAQVVAAPTLIRQFPLPERRLIGDLSQRERVAKLVNLESKPESHG